MCFSNEIKEIEITPLILDSTKLIYCLSDLKQARHNLYMQRDYITVGYRASLPQLNLK